MVRLASGGDGVHDGLRLFTEVLYVGYIGMIRKDLSDNLYPFEMVVEEDLNKQLKKVFLEFDKIEHFLPICPFFKAMDEIFENKNLAMLNTLIRFAYDMMPRLQNNKKCKGSNSEKNN
jgi:hypothetical protein